jgi:hypothetical protein
LGFGGGSRNSPFEAEQFLVGVVLMVRKRKCFCFYKKKGYRYEDELGSKKIAIVP